MTQRQLTKLATLLKRVKRATEARGKKSELARWLGTEPQRVNDWLTGVNAPGGEVTLLLLEWVAAEEANQNKNPGCAQTQPERKTQLRTESKHETKTKSGRKKR